MENKCVLMGNGTVHFATRFAMGSGKLRKSCNLRPENQVFFKKSHRKSWNFRILDC